MTSYQIPDYETFTDSHGKIYRESTYNNIVKQIQEEVQSGDMEILDSKHLLYELQKCYICQYHIQEIIRTLVYEKNGEGSRWEESRSLEQEPILELLNELTQISAELVAAFPDILVPGNKTKSTNKK